MKFKISDYKISQDVFVTVSENDTFESLSNHYGVPVDYIKSLNGTEIYEGKVIYIAQTNLKSYVVKPFDTLQNLAKKHQTSVEDIKFKNSLRNDFVFVGQKLYL